MTQLEAAINNKITPEMEAVAEKEGLSPERVRDGVARGTIVITRNINRNINPLGIGEGLSIKVNANIGTSRDRVDIDEELEKLRTAVDAGAHTIMDLSTGGDITAIRRTILEKCAVPLGTVPVYQVAAEAPGKKKSFLETGPEEWLGVIEQQGKEGVDFITVHCGVTRESVLRYRREGRELDVVSRGGSLTIHWMDHNDAENPLFEHYDRLLEIAREYDMTLSLGDGLRPGCIADATDRGQVAELIQLGELQARALKAGVQVIIEGPGHVPMDQIQANMQIQKRLCHGAPFYVLGPLVTDIAPGYDDITGAIGGALAAWAGADFLCYVTPSEHLRLPDIEDVRRGVIASRIAAHAADVALCKPGAREKDLEMARARKNLDWEKQVSLSIDPERARKLRESRPSGEEDTCSMCGEFCAIKMIKKSVKA